MVPFFDFRSVISHNPSTGSHSSWACVRDKSGALRGIHNNIPPKSEISVRHKAMKRGDEAGRGPEGAGYLSAR